jgi:hypothetical protein
VYLWAELRDDPAAVKPDDLRGLTPEWVPLERLEEEPLFPAELRALARDLLEGRRLTGVPSFPGRLGSPSDRPDYDVFQRIGARSSED